MDKTLQHALSTTQHALPHPDPYACARAGLLLVEGRRREGLEDRLQAPAQLRAHAHAEHDALVGAHLRVEARDGVGAPASRDGLLGARPEGRGDLARWETESRAPN